MKKVLLGLLGTFAAMAFIACETQMMDEVDSMAQYQGMVLTAKDIVQERRDETIASDQEYYVRMMEQLDGMGEFWQEMTDMCEQYEDCDMGGGMSSHMGDNHMGGNMGGNMMGGDHMMTADQMQSMHEDEQHMMDEMELLEQLCLGEDMDMEQCDVYRPNHLDEMDGYLNMHTDICDSMMGE